MQPNKLASTHTNTSKKARIEKSSSLQAERLLLELADLAREVPVLDAGLRSHRVPDDQSPLYWERERAAEGQPACKQCQGPFPILTSASKRNPGKQYQSCWFCDEFQWADDNRSENPLAQLGFSTPGTSAGGTGSLGGASPREPGYGGGPRSTQYASIFRNWRGLQT